MPYKVLLTRIMFKEIEDARIGAGAGERVVDDAGLGLCNFRHLAVEGGEGVGVFGLAVDLGEEVSRRGGERVGSGKEVERRGGG